MAQMEELGFCHSGQPPDYYRRKVMAQDQRQISDRQIALIHDLSKQLGYSADGMAHRMSRRRVAAVEEMEACEAYNTIEALKAIQAEGRAAAPAAPAAKSISATSIEELSDVPF